MNSLRNIQHEFLGYLLDDSAADIERRIVSTPQASAAQRMQFYGNAYRMRLKETLGTDYENLHTYLGDELFDLLVDSYIDRYPSTRPSLRDFGAHMVELVSSVQPFKQWTEVVEISRIEQAFADSFDAADGETVSLQQLGALEPQAWATMSLDFHDSVQLLSLDCNSFSIWQALADGETPPAKTEDASNWLIWREDLVSRYRSLEKEEADALNIALAGGSFAEICQGLLHHFSEQQTAQRALAYLQQWIHDRMVRVLQY